MDVLFESCFESNAAFAREIYRRSIFKRPLMVAVDLFLGLLLVINVVEWLRGGTCQYLVLSYLPLFLLLQYCIYRRTVNTLMKQNRLAGRGKPIQVRTSVTDTTVKTSVTAGTKQEAALSTFQKAAQTKHFILLIAKGGQFCALRKDAFTKGTPEEFLQFLKKKGIR